MTSHQTRKALKAGQIVEVTFGDVKGLARCLGGKPAPVKRAPTEAELTLAAAYKAHVAKMSNK